MRANGGCRLLPLTASAAARPRRPALIAPPPSLTHCCAPPSPATGTIAVAMSDMEVDESSPAEAEVEQPLKPAVIGASNPFLQLFWQLADEHPAVRATAEQSLLAHLTSSQFAHSSSSPSPSDPLAADVRYALKRLFRGLCSSRGQARAGFSSALSSLLSLPALPITIPLLLPLMSSSLAPPSSPSKQEQTDHKLGFAHAILALCRAGQATSLPSSDVSAFVTRLLGFESSHVLRESAWRAVEALVLGVEWEVYQQHIEQQLLQKLAHPDDEEEADSAADAKVKEEEQAEAVPRKKKGKGTEKGKGAGKAKEVKSEIPTALVELHQLTPERLSVLLAVLRVYRSHEQPTASLSAHLAPSALTPLSPSTFPMLVDILSSAAYTLPALHSAYSTTLTALLSSASSDWALLYTLLASTLFAERASTARKQQGLLIFELMLQLLPQHTHHSLPAAVSHLFHPLLVRTLLNSLASPSTHLHQHCRLALTALLTLARQRRDIVLPVMAGLSGHSGKGRFDAVTKTKTMATLVGLMRREDLGGYVDGLTAAFQEEGKEGDGKERAGTVEGGEDDEATSAVDEREKQQLWVLEQLYSATRQAALAYSAAGVDTTATERALHFFLFYAFFDTTAPPAVKPTAKKGRKKAPESAVAAVPSVCRPLLSPLSERVRGVCATRLWSLLDDLLPRPKGKLSPQEQKKKTKEDKKAVRAAAAAAAASAPQSTAEAEEKEEEEKEGDSLWVLKAHECWDALEAAGFSLLTPLSEEGRAVRRSMRGIVSEVEERRASGGVERERLKKERALSLLLLHLGLLQLTEDASITPLLQELDLGYQQVWKAKAEREQPKPSSSRKRKAAEEEEEATDDEQPQPVFVEALVDILLSLLVRPSALIRTLSRLVFVAFAGDVNESALTDMLRVVTQKSGQQPKEPGDTAEDEDDDDFQPFDVDDADASEEEQEEAEEEEEAMPAPRTASATASSTKKRKRSEASPPADESSDDELVELDALEELLVAPLTDEEQAEVDAASASFEHYDAHLSNIIRLRQQGKKAQQTDLQQQQLNFQLRVMDLLDVYARVEGHSRLLLELVLPRLLDGAQVTRKAERLAGLHERLTGLLQRIAQSKQHPTIVFPEESKEEEQTGKGKKGRKGVKAKVVERAAEAVELSTHSLRVESLQRLMAALMERAQRAVNSELLSLTSQCLLHLTRISLPPSSLVSPSSHSSLSSPLLSHLRFVHSQYHSALTSYLNHRHGRLNSRFFSDFLHAAPALAWLSAPTLARMAVVEVTAEEKEAEQERAANGFLRNDCFVWLGELFGRKDMLQQLGKEEVDGVVNSVAQAVESAFAYAALDDAAKAKLREARDSSDAQTTAAVAAVVTSTPQPVSVLSKEERLRLKAKEKKKRRRQRQKATTPTAIPSTLLSSTQPSSCSDSSDSSSSTAARVVLRRLKVVLKTACTVQAQAKRLQLGQGALTAPVVRALEGLGQEWVRGLRGDLVNLLRVGGRAEPEAMRRMKEEGESRKKSRAMQRQQAEQQRKDTVGAGRSPAPSAATARPHTRREGASRSADGAERGRDSSPTAVAAAVRKGGREEKAKATAVDEVEQARPVDKAQRKVQQGKREGSTRQRQQQQRHAQAAGKDKEEVEVEGRKAAIGPASAGAWKRRHQAAAATAPTTPHAQPPHQRARA